MLVKTNSFHLCSAKREVEIHYCITFLLEKSNTITNTFRHLYRPPPRPSTESARVSTADVSGYAGILSCLPMDLDNSVDGLLRIPAFGSLCKVDKTNLQMLRLECQLYESRLVQNTESTLPFSNDKMYALQ